MENNRYCNSCVRNTRSYENFLFCVHCCNFPGNECGGLNEYVQRHIECLSCTMEKCNNCSYSFEGALPSGYIRADEEGK